MMNIFHKNKILHLSAALMTLLLLFAGITPCFSDTIQDLKAFDLLEKETLYMKAEMFETDITTAGKRPQKLKISPSSISVVTAEDIKQSGATQISEALMMLSGVDIAYTTTTAPLSGGIRGFHKLPVNKILFLIDGNPWIFEQYGLCMFTFLPISLDDVERIEVLKGSGSSLYGPNAMFGLINIITKKPKDTKGFNASITGGEWGTLINDIRYSGTLEDSFSYMLSAGSHRMKNPEYVAWQNTPNKEYYRVYSNMTYSFGKDASMWLASGYVNNKYAEVITESTGLIDFSGKDTYFSAITYQAQNPNLKITGYLKEEDEGSGKAMGEHYFGFKEGIRSIDFQHDFNPFHNDQLLWGGNLTYQHCDGLSIQNKQAHSLQGMFIDNTYSLANSTNYELAFNSGIRYDHHSKTGNSLSHRLSFIYSLMETHYFRLTWGSSYRNPDFIESYYNRYSLYKQEDANPLSLSSDIYLHVYGQEENDPEKAISYEIAYTVQLSPQYSLNTILFYTKVKDFIYFIADPEKRYFDNELNVNVIPMPFKNIGNAHQYGAETEFRWQISPMLSSVLNYTWYDQQEEQKTVAQLISMTPRHMANAQLRLNMPNGFSANISLHFRDTTEWRTYTWRNPERDTNVGGTAPSYTITNMRLGYTFSMAKTQIETALSVFNLLDKHYDAYPIDTSDITRRITLLVSFNF
ncbi:MAG: TonB-dependent receptor [Desulfobacterales bacterium]|nr:TonB-dependent receptor [Desulfobacterales bacterium]